MFYIFLYIILDIFTPLNLLQVHESLHSSNSRFIVSFRYYNEYFNLDFLDIFDIIRILYILVN